MHFLDLIKEDGLILDIGANIGIMTVHLAQRFPNSTILSFEPVPTNITCLKRVVNRFGLKNVMIIETALGDKSGELEMIMPVWGNVKKQGLSHVVGADNISQNDINPNEKGLHYKVPVTTIDQFLEKEFPSQKIVAIKIDVENFEYPVFLGAQKTVSDYHPIIYSELWENENRSNCFSLMKSLSYKIMILSNDKLILFDEKIHKTQNFFFMN